jgi:hypothetical protein
MPITKLVQRFFNRVWCSFATRLSRIELIQLIILMPFSLTKRSQGQSQSATKGYGAALFAIMVLAFNSIAGRKESIMKRISFNYCRSFQRL